MGYFRNLYRAISGNPLTDRAFWPESNMPVAAEVNVNSETVLQLPIVQTCLNLLAKPIASCPFPVYRKRPSGGRDEDMSHPLYRVLNVKPNWFQTPYEFRGFMEWNLAFYRNAYAEILPGPDYFVGELIPIHPNNVTPEPQTDGTIWYRVRDPLTGRSRRIESASMWHMKSLPFAQDGISGLSVVRTHREVLGRAIALQDYGARFFANDMQTGGVIEHPGRFGNDDQRKRYKQAMRDAWSGQNRHLPKLLEDGAKFQQQQLNNETAQFLETGKELDVRIAEIWNITPHKAGNLDRATFSNVENLSIEFVTQTIAPEAKLWKDSVKSHLIEDPSIEAELDLDALLQGDFLSRMQALAIGRNWGILSTNECREEISRNPIDGGDDDFIRPGNMLPADAPPSLNQQKSDAILEVINGGRA